MEGEPHKMSGRLHLLVLGCLFLKVECEIGQPLPPRNLSVEWLTDFDVNFTWAPSPSQHCKYSYQITAKNDGFTRRESNTTFTRFIPMDGGSLNFSIQTDCNGKKSKTAVLNTIYPDGVKNLQCYLVSSNQARCSWDTVSPPPVALSFFYRLIERGVDSRPYSPLQECPQYRETNGVRSGCNMEANYDQVIHISVRGTVNNTFFRNTFVFNKFDVRPPPLNWTVEKTGGKFHISWKPLDIGSQSWKYNISYTECNQPKHLTTEETAAEVEVLSYCQYCINIRATYGEDYSSPWSKEKCFDAEPNKFVYAAILVPLAFACLVVLISVFCRRNKEHLFPKVPVPRDLISDIFDNNNKSPLRPLYTPGIEEETCKITLMNPESNKRDC